MSIRTSREIQRDGFVIYPFPESLSKKMKDYICKFMGIDVPTHFEQVQIEEKLTEISLKLSDEEFIRRFAKPYRMFPDSIAKDAVEWVASLSQKLGGKIAGVNFICPEEKSKNSALRGDSYDVFWRCVRPGKPDVGAAHCDFQFWEIAKGTSLEVGVPFEYDERWKIWAPLYGCNIENSLQILPKSHNENVPTDIKLTNNGYKPIIHQNWLEKKEPDFLCPLVDFHTQCVLFHDKLVHRGPLNRANTLRISCELTILLKI